MVFATWVGFFYMYIFLYTLVVTTFNKTPDPVIDYLKRVNYSVLVSYFLIFSVLVIGVVNIGAYILKNLRAKTTKTTNLHDIILPFLSYYPVLPLFMISIGFLLTTFFVFGRVIFILGFILIIIGIFLLYMMYLIKSNYESKIYYTLHKADDILNKIDLDDKDYYRIREFNKYFIKFINNLDGKLKKGIKINNLLKEDTSAPIKDVIVYYLPVFMKFASQKQIDSLRNRINLMSDLVEKNDEFKLNITSVIVEIYQDIKEFLESNKYPVAKHGWQINLSLFKDRDLLFFIFGTIQTVVLIVYIVIKGVPI